MADNYNLEDGLKKLIIENTYVLLSDKDFTEYSDLITDFGYDSHSTKPNQFCLEIIVCRVCSSFDYLIYPYYPAYMS